MQDNRCISNIYGSGTQTRYLTCAKLRKLLITKTLVGFVAERYTPDMLRCTVLLLFVASAPLAFGQLDTNTITVSASRSVSLMPDQVVFTVTVQSGLNVGLDDVLAALQGTGITAANFTSSNGGFVVFDPTTALHPPIQWTFSLPVPLTKIKDTLTALSALQKTIGQNNSGMSVAFTLHGPQVSAQLFSSQSCSLADLIVDARTQADKLAGAAGLRVGGILAMSTFASSSIGNVGNPFFGSSVVPPGCSATIKFALLR